MPVCEFAASDLTFEVVLHPNVGAAEGCDLLIVL